LQDSIDYIGKIDDEEKLRFFNELKEEVIKYKKNKIK